MKKIITLLSIIMLFSTAMVFGQAGKLDSTFGIKGVVKMRYSVYGDYIKDMAIQPDGKTIIAGYVKKDTAGTRSCFMTRYKLNGSTDSTFGNNGTVLLSIGSSDIVSIAQQTDGKILAIGNIHQSSQDYMGVYRFNNNGSLDTSFNHSGLDSILAVIPGNIRVAPSGSIYIGAQSYNYCIIKYTSDGMIDNSYGISGYSYFPVTLQGVFTADTSIGTLQLITLQSDEKVLYPLKASKDLALLRFDNSGNIDTLFGNKGLARTHLNHWGDFGNICAVQADGKIIVSGYSTDTAALATRLAMVRFNTNGTIDTVFGNKGKVVNSIMTYSSIPTPVAIQSDGKIVLAATRQDTATTHGVAFALTRYNSNGKIDTTFGKKGIDTTQFTPDCYLAAMQISPYSGRIEVTGTARGVSKTLPPFAITARYFPTKINVGVVDLALNNNKMFVYPNPVNNNFTIAYTLSKDQTLSIYMYDMQGRIVKQLMNNNLQSAGTNTLPVNMQSIASGEYIVTLSNNNGEHISYKIVKE